jgi:hypothetical protein
MTLLRLEPRQLQQAEHDNPDKDDRRMRLAAAWLTFGLPALMSSATPAAPPYTGTGVVTFLMG